MGLAGQLIERGAGAKLCFCAHRTVNRVRVTALWDVDGELDAVRLAGLCFRVAFSRR